MSIINKGVFDLKTATLRQTGNDWPTAQVITTSDVVESASNLYFTSDRVVSVVTPLLTTANVVELDNLYFTNERVVSNVTTLMKSFEGTGISIDATTGVISVASADFSEQSGTANTVLSLDNFTTANLLESSSNLYYTNARARAAFTAGRGILISDTGTITGTVSQSEFSSTIDASADYIVKDTLSPALVFPFVSESTKYILRSMHITNISDDTAFITSNVLFATSNTAQLAEMMPIPVGSVIEFMDRVQLFQANDSINIQGFDASKTPGSDLLSASFTYETIPDASPYNGVGEVLPYANNYVQVADFLDSDAVLESAKFINHKDYSIPVTLYTGYANGDPKSYLAFNFPVPPHASLEVLQKPKYIKITDKLFAKYSNSSNADSISIFTSYRYAAVTSTLGSTTLSTPGGNVGTVFTTTYPDGTTLYYTLD